MRLKVTRTEQGRTQSDTDNLKDTGQQSLLDNILASDSYRNKLQSLAPAMSMLSSCPPMPVTPIPIPEYVAEAVRNGNLYTWAQFIAAFDELPYIYMTTDDYIALDTLCNSPGYSTNSTIVRFWLQDTTCQQYVTLSYVGTNPPTPTPTAATTTSIPGTVIVETAPPAPVMPAPPMPEVFPQIQKAIIDSISQPMEQAQQAIDQTTGTAKGQLEYQLQQVEAPLQKLLSKIDSNIVNTMGEVYSEAYPVGLGIPSTDQIISGEPVYSPYGIGADIPYAPTPPATTPPGVTCPAPVVQCPAPPDITFSPNIVVNIPKQDGTSVSVNVTPPAPTPTEPYTTTEPTEPTPTPYEEPEEPEEPDIVVIVEAPSPTEPTPSPTPAPTPTEEPKEEPTPTPTEPKEAPLGLPRGILPRETSAWGIGAPCTGSPHGISADMDQFWNFFGWTGGSGGVWTPPGYINPNNYPSGFKWFGSFLMNLEGLLISSTIKSFGASLPIASNFGDFLALAVGGVVQNWVGAPVLQFMQSNIYNINYNNPQRIPSEAEVVSLYLSGEITEDVMRCLVRANGSFDTWYGLIANANRTKLTNGELIQLRRRNIIDDTTTNKLMRANGVIDEQEQLLMYKASEAMPSVSDIVRFMVRDAGDNTVAGKYGTDDALNNKYSKQLQDWAKGQGITDEVMKYYWRSHWEIPSNTALFEMLHRLRPGRQGAGGAGGITVSPDDIKDALVVNDVLPFWADRLMEISYKPLTRVDAQRAFFIDALSENELTDAYLDLGYNAFNAAKLVRFTNQLKAKRKQVSGGTERPTSVLKYYKNWLIGDTEARQRLKNSGLSETAANESLQIAATQRKNDSQLACIKGIKSQYKRFIIDDIEARRDLTAIGVAVENVTPLVAQWNCERANKPKELTAAQVCNAYKNLLITKEEYYRRLNAIGYHEDETGILLELCAAGKGNKNNPANVITGIKKEVDTGAQTAKARAITQAALDALAKGN